jgi:hypothetical protein
VQHPKRVKTLKKRSRQNIQPFFGFKTRSLSDLGFTCGDRRRCGGRIRRFDDRRCCRRDHRG